ncbi:MAG: Asp-tRNA(Asn)/Glu-tRNA(Gln) amidotransferase subunit GatC [bacterium]
MNLSKDEIKHIAKLARLELTDAELEKYGGQLSAVLNYIDQLKEVDVKGIEPMAQASCLENVLREDEIKNWDEQEIEEALAGAPEREGGFIKVKRVIE